MTDEREETDGGVGTTAGWNGRDVIAAQQDVPNRSTGQRERATELFRLAV